MVIGQSKHTPVVPYVVIESQAHDDGN